MIYGYARVSAKAQLKGNSLEEQRAELLRNGCNVIIEEQFTGKTTARPKFDDLIKNRIQKGDTLIVTKLDRFARNVTEGIATIKHLFNKGARIHVLNVGLLENTAMGNFFITTLLAVAELERCMILERTASGKEIARMRSGYKEGRPPIPKRTIALLTEYKQDCEEFLKKKKCTNPEGILFFQRRNIKKGSVSYAYGSGLRARLRKISKYLLQGKGICPYSLRKLGDTERKNAAEIPARVSDYIMGHNGNPLDLRYVSDYYPLAKKAMPAWEKVLDGILSTETK